MDSSKLYKKNLDVKNEIRDIELNNINTCKSNKLNNVDLIKETANDIKLSNHDNEYDGKFIEKDVNNLNKLKEEIIPISNNSKEKRKNVKATEIDTKNARQMFQQKLNSTQSTMNIEAILANDNEEIINNANCEMDILDNNNKNNENEDLNQKDINKTFYISNIDYSSDNQADISFFKKIKMCFNYFGPGWIVAIAYLDPGNLCSNLNVGLSRSPSITLEKDYTGYNFLWVLIYGHLLGLLFQILSMKLGHVTGLDLASICYNEFNKKTSFFLYVFVQIAIWGAHIQAIIGTLVAFNLIFGISLKIAVFYTLFEALIYSILENRSLKLLENILSILIGFLAICFFINVFMTPINLKEVLLGIIYPRIPKGKEVDTLGLLGSIISAHIFYLHTNLTAKKNAIISNEKKLRRYNILGTIESMGSLFLSCLTNFIIILTFAEVNLQEDDIRDEYNLFTGYEVMKKSFGYISMYIWSIGLLSSGNNSSFMCEYATKSVFEGFLNKKVNTFSRVLSFRLLLFLLIFIFLLFEKYSIDQLTNFINVVQVLLLPMAIVPLYRFSIHRNVLGNFALKSYSKVFVFVIIITIIFANLILTAIDFMQKDYNTSFLFVMIVFSIIYLYIIYFFFNIPVTKNYCHNFN